MSNHGNGCCGACGHKFLEDEKTVVVAPFVFCNKPECHGQGVPQQGPHYRDYKQTPPPQ